MKNVSALIALGILFGIASACSGQTYFNEDLKASDVYRANQVREYEKYIRSLAGSGAQINAVLKPNYRNKSDYEKSVQPYRKAFAAVADQALSQGHNAIHPLLEQAGVVAVTEKELGEAGFSEQMFRNINTIMDLEANSGCRKP